MVKIDHQILCIFVYQFVLTAEDRKQKNLYVINNYQEFFSSNNFVLNELGSSKLLFVHTATKNKIKLNIILNFMIIFIFFKNQFNPKNINTKHIFQNSFLQNCLKSSSKYIFSDGLTFDAQNTR